MPRKDRCDRGRALLALGITSIPNEFSRRRYIRPWFSAANQGPSSSSHWYEKVLEHRFCIRISFTAMSSTIITEAESIMHAIFLARARRMVPTMSAWVQIIIQVRPS